MSSKTPNERWSRLQSMTADELFDRVRQRFSARTDALRYRLGLSLAIPVRETHGPAPRFFFDEVSLPEILNILRNRLPEQAEQIVSRGEKICSHKFDLLGYEDLDYGKEIDWHSDRVHGKTAPRKPFHQVRYLDFREVGDSKITWELNRHQHLVVLAKAYRLTGNEKYANELIAQWRHWIAENPYPVGINWASSLEVAFRSLSWIWVRALLRGTAVWTDKIEREWLRWTGISGRHIDRYLSTYFSPNTHLLGEAVALFFIGTLCPSLARSEKWKTKGWNVVLQQAERQVQADGLHFEQSTYYHVYALDFFLHARILGGLNGVDIPPQFDCTLEKMCDALLLLSRAGVPPGFGDDDGGRLFDPARNRMEHMLDPLATGAILFARGDFKSLAGETREETFWLLDPAGVKKFDELSEREPSAASVALEAGGMYLMASPECGEQLVIDAGPQGAATAGHGHADALGVCLTTRGRPALIDPGTCEYVGDDSDRDQFRGTAAHNTVQVDGHDQAEPKGPFAWTSLPNTKVERWITGNSFDFFVGSHDGYQRLESPVLHRRSVFSLKNGIYLVRDIVEGNGEHQVDLRWHFAPNFKPQNGEARVYKLGEGESRLALFAIGPSGIGGKHASDFWSPVYGRKEKAGIVRLGGKMTLPADFATLLISLSKVTDKVGEFSRALENSPAVSGYSYKSERDQYRFFFSSSGQGCHLGSTKSDAELVCTGVAANGDRLVILINGSFVEANGSTIVACSRPVERCELIERQGVLRIACSDEAAVVSTSKLHALTMERELVPTRSGSNGADH